MYLYKKKDWRTERMQYACAWPDSTRWQRAVVHHILRLLLLRPFCVQWGAREGHETYEGRFSVRTCISPKSKERTQVGDQKRQQSEGVIKYDIPVRALSRMPNGPNQLHKNYQFWSVFAESSTIQLFVLISNTLPPN